MSRQRFKLVTIHLSEEYAVKERYGRARWGWTRLGSFIRDINSLVWKKSFLYYKSCLKTQILLSYLLQKISYTLRKNFQVLVCSMSLSTNFLYFVALVLWDNLSRISGIIKLILSRKCLNRPISTDATSEKNRFWACMFKVTWYIIRKCKD